ncbi:MAG: D-glucuronyl C5-epimerase family protein [Verrucomicrobiales bacterium]
MTKGIHLRVIYRLLLSLCCLTMTALARDIERGELVFNNSFPEIHRVDPTNHLYYFASPVTFPDDGHDRDPEGIRMWNIEGELHNHPVLQSSFGINLVYSWEQTGRAGYLELAAKYFDRLQSYSVVSRGGRFYPYSYVWELGYPVTDPIHPPWYSAMAQGRVLSFFSRMYQATGEEKYLTAAREVFATFKLPPSMEQPWVVMLDEKNNLWFEEYAQTPLLGDHVLNGHIFGLIGVYDYQQIIKDPASLPILQGGITAVKNRIEELRTPGYASKYCLRHRYLTQSYHIVHTEQLNFLYRITHDTFFARMVDLFAVDSADPKVSGVVEMVGGVNGALYHVAGNIVTPKSELFLTPTNFTFSSRTGVQNQPGAFFKVSSGPFEGLFVQEYPGRVYVKKIIQLLEFHPARTVHLPVKTSFFFYDYDKNGNILSSKLRLFEEPVHTFADARAFIHSRPHIRISEGEFKGLWVPLRVEIDLDLPAPDSSTLDSDGDGITDQDELAGGTNAFDGDTDHDGFVDGVEIASGTDPLSSNSKPSVDVSIKQAFEIEFTGQKGQLYQLQSSSDLKMWQNVGHPFQSEGQKWQTFKSKEPDGLFYRMTPLSKGK